MGNVTNFISLRYEIKINMADTVGVASLLRDTVHESDYLKYMEINSEK